MDVILSDADRHAAAADGPEGVVRSLLAVLEAASDLDAIYVTRFDARAGTLEVAFSRHAWAQPLTIPEGLAVPWDDTLCRRALRERVPYTTHADALWSGNNAVRHLGIRTFLSQPLRGANGELLGTLCGASGRRVDIADNTRRLFAVFAQLIAHQLLGHEETRRLRRDNALLQAEAATDALTGVASRRALSRALDAALGGAARRAEKVAAVFIDLDRFKDINDRHGHLAGDRFLVQVAGRLAAVTRRGETLARYGGDEFVVMATLPPGAPEDAAARAAVRFATATQGRFELGSVAFNYAGASVGVAVATPDETTDALLARADRAMLAAKQTRTQTRH